MAEVVVIGAGVGGLAAAIRLRAAGHGVTVLERRAEVGGKLAVEVRFEDKPGHVDFIHTQTSEQFQGHGLAKVLIHFALDDVVASGKRIIPHCPFTARYLRKHEVYTQCIDWPEAAAPKLLGT